MQRQISVNLGNLLLSLSEIMDIANPFIAQHQQRTAFIAWEIAKDAGLNTESTENLFTAALLHDIGALSIEEKLNIHGGSTADIDLHCRRGEILLAQTPWFQKISGIVGNHHRNMKDWDHPLLDSVVYSAQIIFLSDYVERLIDRGKYILHQHQDIIAQIRNLPGGVIDQRIISHFINAAKREEFWLDLASSRLYQILLRHGPYRNIEIDLKEIAVIAELCRDIIDFKSRFTATHTVGVSVCAGRLSQLFGLTEIEIELMKIAGNLHDIGKLIIPNSILEKPDKLTEDEFLLIKSHTYYTYYVIDSISGLQQIAGWAAYHHEKLDGTGYPFHCKANELDIGARIMAVADIFTAISEDRPYRSGMTRNEIYCTLKSLAKNKAVDSRVVDLLFDNYEVVNTHVKEEQIAAREFYEKRFMSIMEASTLVC